MICCTPQSTTSAKLSTPRTPYNMQRSCAAAVAYDDNKAIFPFPGPAPALHQRELYLRALEQEREEILAVAYAANRSGSPEFGVEFEHPEEQDDDEEEMNASPASRSNFRETVRQRQARLEFLRRQEFARRLAHRGLEDAKASAYAIKRLPPPRARPIERVNAAITIQHFYRLTRHISALHALSARVQTAHDEFMRASEVDFDAAWEEHVKVLHGLLRELGERTGVLPESGTKADGVECAGSLKVKEHPRARRAAREAMETLRNELAFLDKAQISRHSSSSSVSIRSISSSSSSDDSESDFDDDDEIDSDDEDEDEYASYTYTPPPAYSTALYVVDEEDENIDEAESHFEVIPPIKHHQHHRRIRHASLVAPTPIRAFSYAPPSRTPVMPISSSTSFVIPRSPLARSPSLASIPEELQEEYY